MSNDLLLWIIEAALGGVLWLVWRALKDLDHRVQVLEGQVKHAAPDEWRRF